MFLRRFYEEHLAQASYLIGCQQSGEALVVDANRDAEQYIAGAAAEGLRITHVTETHIHADYVSGSRELAERAGANLLLSSAGGPEWHYAFAAGAGAQLLADGSRFSVGNVRVDVMHTPGHTPEHLTFLVTDTAVADRPLAAITGDFVFVGDVGRPDLLERAAHVAGTMTSSARDLFRSLQRFKQLPDYLQLWPGHGAGSACGKALGAMPQSTLGYERLFNWALTEADAQRFVNTVLDGQPEPPRYFAAMKRINREGPAVLGGLPHPERLGAARLRAALDAGALVIDTRHAADFAAGHVPGTINIPLNRSFATWAGSLLPLDHAVHLLVDEDDAPMLAARAARTLSLIGFDRMGGYFGAEAIDEWRAAGGATETVPTLTAAELRSRMAAGSVTVIDVRNDSEWTAGHLEGATWIPLATLTDHLGAVESNEPVVLHCQGGTRSAIATSLLLAAGRKNVSNLAGGFVEWSAAGFPIEH
ncbi:MAG TPA: rhodanese-like domain-containing protein [Gemmatimonadaceae bacterium]|nr:rhodanese-like domain-containing protein [Gemmatimonadaceae bacterium]